MLQHKHSLALAELSFLKLKCSPSLSDLFNIWPPSVCAGYPGAVGTAPADLEHHQAGAEEEPAGRPGRLKVLRLQRDCQQPEVHELHLGR